ncbi:hypothetical protein L0244_06265 [bacterium]|nr:hypothetical protein [bacterium]
MPNNIYTTELNRPEWVEYLDAGWAEVTADEKTAYIRCFFCKKLAVASLNPARLTIDNPNFSKHRYVSDQIMIQTGYIQCYDKRNDDEFNWICSKECEALHELAK